MKPLPQSQSLPPAESEEFKLPEDLQGLDKVYLYKNDGFPKLVKIEARGQNGNKFDNPKKAKLPAEPLSQPNTRPAVQIRHEVETGAPRASSARY